MSALTIKNIPEFNPAWFQALKVTDQLHVRSLDVFLMHVAPKFANSVTIIGAEFVGGQIIPSDGMHSIFIDDNNWIHMDRSVDKDDKPFYTVKAEGFQCMNKIAYITNPKRISVKNSAVVSELDNFVMQEFDLLNTGQYTVDMNPVPNEGFYPFYHEKDGVESFMIVERSSDEKGENLIYKIDILGDHFNAVIDSIINGDANCIKILVCFIFSHTMIARLNYKPPIAIMHPSQEDIVNRILEMYNGHSDRNVVCLICGPPGTGKTTNGVLVAQTMRQTMGVNPIVVEGFDTTAPEMQFHKIVKEVTPTKKNPVILVIDEIDIAFEAADNQAGGSSQQQQMRMMGNSHAKNKSTMTKLLDDLNKDSFLIVIATSNLTVDEMHQKYGVYCRMGRFDQHCYTLDANTVEFIDPPVATASMNTV